MTVSSTHPQYDFYCPRWALTSDVVNSTASKYIRTIDDEDKLRSSQYVADAILTNFTARTKQGLIGAAFRLAPTVELTTTTEYLLEDATGNNLGLEALSKALVGDVLETGHVGLLVDFPQSSLEAPTKEETEAMNNLARITKYEACSIINWNTDRVGGNTVLTLVVLREAGTVLLEDGFTWMTQVVYRELRLEDGIYIQRLWDEGGRIIEEMVPRKADGSLWNEIPFVFIGSENNDSEIDNAPLYDLATLNIGHLKNSADYEESVHIVGQPTLFLTSSMTTEQWKDLNPNGITIGSRKGHLLGDTGSAMLLQPDANQLADVAMQRKEQQAVMLGARLITPNSGVETAEAARIRHGSENSVLSCVVHNVGDGLEDAIEFVAEFMGTDSSEISYSLNDMFFDSTVNPQMIMAQIQLLDRGIIAKTDIRGDLRKAGTIDPERTDEEIDGDVEVTDPIV